MEIFYEKYLKEKLIPTSTIEIIEIEFVSYFEITSYNALSIRVLSLSLEI